MARRSKSEWGDFDSSSFRNLFFTALIYVSIIVLIISVATPIGNQKFNNTVVGSYDSTGAAIILIGLPYIFLHLRRS